LDGAQLHVSRSGGSARFHPHFEPVEGEAPRFLGLVGREAALAPGEANVAKEVAITSGLVADLEARARARGAKLVVVALREADGGTVPEEVRGDMLRRGIPLIDLSERELSFFSGDPHPDVRGHAEIADLLAKALPPYLPPVRGPSGSGGPQTEP
jgi:hypothetical protein